MLLFNMFNNRLDDLINNFDKKDVISHCWNRNTTSSQLSATKRNIIASYFEIEEGAIKKNRVASHTKIEKEMEG